MQAELIKKYGRPVPRYTSYPTAPHFCENMDEGIYGNWLSRLGRQHSLSLYVHIPFCDSLCWFCGCHTKHTRKYQPVADYLKVLKKEVTAIASRMSGRPKFNRLHWGGGSPTILQDADILDLAGCIKSHFSPSDAFEFSVEIDPRDLSERQMHALAEAGMTRASIGVQDFNLHVQNHINRIQTFEETERVVQGLRERGVQSLNLDVMYGLPGQDLQDLRSTVEKAIELAPDRIALFGYAHVPWMKKHQSMIREDLLPGPEARFEQAEQAADLLVAAGYQRIGFDHFAQPGDGLAVAMENRTLRRNFQGYTDDTADALVGIGASAIGKLPEGYVQNCVATGDYMRRVGETGLAPVKGYRLQPEDRMRAHLIERLMCDYEISAPDLMSSFGNGARPLVDELARFAANDADRLLGNEGERYFVTERGRPFIRTIASAFDGFLGTSGARHSTAV